MKQKWKAWYPYLLLTAFTLLLVYVITPKGALYGSTTDWENQHIVIPEYFRTLFYSSHQLFPDYAPHLGAGENIYAFSYYGLFRPDILFSYLLPNVPMEKIITGYVILELAASVNLCYYWLKRQGIKEAVCFFASMLLPLSAILFQSHRQIMFMNYMPFLILAFIGIDLLIKKGKSAVLTAAMFLMILHSYFFSVTALFLCFVYYLYGLSQTGEGRIFRGNGKKFLKFTLSTGIAVCMAGILLVPTAVYMLGGSRGQSTSFWEQMTGFDFSLKSLLYSSYGCGFTGIVLCVLLAAAAGSRAKKLSWFLLVCLASNGFRYLANGTLYARNKIYLTFIPLVLYVIAVALDEMLKGKLRLRWPVLLFALIPLYFWDKSSEYLLLIDLAVAVLCLLYYYKKKSPFSLAAMLILPLIICMHTNAKESYANESAKDQSGEELIYPVTAGDARFADSTRPLYTSNRVPNASLYKTSMYSSLTNGDYSSFFYDMMKNPISIRNRAALLTNPNIFFEQFMNVKYMMAKEGTLPAGYQEVSRQGEYVFGESQDVLPLAYATSSLTGREEFEKLTYPYNLDTIINTAVIPGQTDSDAASYKSKMKKEGQQLRLNQIQGIQAVKGGYEADFSKEEEMEVPLEKTYQNKILLLSFDVKSRDGREVTISVNGIRNRLSGRKAAYPNENQHFTYILSGQEELSQLDFLMSAGNYGISNIQLYSLDYGVIQNRARQVDPLRLGTVQGSGVLSGDIQAKGDGYFITSLPYEKGFRAFVDEKEVEIEKVNTAFVGFPMSKGSHSVRLEFRAPGKMLGMALTIAGFGGFILCLFLERKKKKAF